MTPWATIAIAVALVPIFRALWANRRTTLLHALIWAVAAWIAALAAAITGSVLATYIALCLAACAGVSVLGARKPGVGAWHAVVAGLLAVLLMPIAEGFFAAGVEQIDHVRIWFLGIVLTFGLANYVPTRLGIGAIVLWAASVLCLRSLLEVSDSERQLAFVLAGSSPWLAWLGTWSRTTSPEADRQWRSFRERFGIVWAQRVREQFNRAAENSNLSVELGWTELHRRDSLPLSAADRDAAVELLHSLMMRFGMPG